ncbi:MAG: exodeoxyribonuclease V subunit alpha [Chlamydiae bacterium]|nr:exodeoxyribonuclease V subunit alpha [Chlamydiota bacterium]
MLGKVVKIFLNIKGISQPKWLFLWDLVQRKELLTIDYLFAEKMASNEGEEGAALAAVIFAFSRLGHICVKIEGEEISPSLELLVSDVQQRNILKKLVKEGARNFSAEGLVRYGNGFYLEKNEGAEAQIAFHVKRLLSTAPKEVKSKHLANDRLSEEQKMALVNGCKYGLSLITGGPGSGKTFTASHLVSHFLHHSDFSIALAAPTGKAAAHLRAKVEENRRIVSGTLHTILDVYRMEENSLLYFADLVIVDECSMIDIHLFAKLLSRIKRGARLILMGDSNQLPSIEGGSIFADLVNAKFSIPTTYLNRSFRSEKKEFLSLSNAILKKDQKKLFHQLKQDSILWKNMDFSKQDPITFYQMLWQRVKEKFPHPGKEKPDLEKLKRQVDHFRIINALKKGPFGADKINEWLATQFIDLCRGEDYFLPMPIIITRNDLTLGLCNGDVGWLIKSSRKEEEYALFENRIFSPWQLPSFEYAYCLSIHKCQGSEYEKVLILLPDGSEIFGKELFFTAVTRAKKEIEIHGSEKVIHDLIEKDSYKISGIQDRLLEEVK